MQPLVLGTAQINTTDAAVFTVTAGQVWEITAITITHPSTGLAKNIAIGFGTTATAANVKWNQAFAAGVQSTAFYPGWSLQPAATLNVVSSADANIAIIVVSGFK